jgi:hypothetical protein
MKAGGEILNVWSLVGILKAILRINNSAYVCIIFNDINYVFPIITGGIQKIPLRDQRDL